MSNYAIRVNNLGKMYRIGGLQDNQQTFREAIVKTAGSPFKKVRDLMRGQAYAAAGLHEEVWALKDINFDVMHGEVVGIIGRNGAGKSTLLKILSRITDPSVGYADVYGRVGALLEVGTGFHQELSGRENVYLNGAILGMDRGEIDKKFDEIVDFAGVEKFIDTPVKHYSSGMRLRLGFAVAAHLEPDILVVDEVLAVGDAEFQKKCMGKMSDVAGEGRTVLFVSHNMSAIQNLCERCVLLESGNVVATGLTQDIVNRYLGGITERLEIPLIDRTDRRGSGLLQFSSFRILNDQLDPITEVQCGQSLRFELGFKVNSSEPVKEVVVQINIHDNQDRLVTQLMTKHTGQNFDTITQTDVVHCEIPFLPLLPGKYFLNIHAKHPPNETIDVIDHAVDINVILGDVYGTGKLPNSQAGVVVIPHNWSKKVLAKDIST